MMDLIEQGKFPTEGGEWPIVQAVVMYGPGEQVAVLAVAPDYPNPWHWQPCWWCGWFLSPASGGLCPYCKHQNDPAPFTTGITNIDGETVEPQRAAWPQLREGIDNGG